MPLLISLTCTHTHTPLTHQHFPTHTHRWLRGQSITTGQRGIAPRAYTTYDGADDARTAPAASAFAAPLDRAGRVLRAWALQLSRYAHARDAAHFVALEQLAAALLALRWALVAAVERHEPTVVPPAAPDALPHHLSDDECQTLALRIGEEIDAVTHLLGLELTVPCPAAAATSSSATSSSSSASSVASLLSCGPNQLCALYEGRAGEGADDEGAAGAGARGFSRPRLAHDAQRPLALLCEEGAATAAACAVPGDTTASAATATAAAAAALQERATGQMQEEEEEWGTTRRAGRRSRSVCR